MFIEIKFNDSKPIYLQIKDKIKEMILSGMLQKKTKLPSSRELSKILKVSRNTIMESYSYLEEEGFIYTIKSKGVFVADIKTNNQESFNINWEDRINDYAESAEKLDIVKHEAVWKKGMISFKSIAPDNSLFDVDEFKKSFLMRMSIEGDKLLNYGYASGYKPLQEYLKNYMSSKGVNVENKDILITNGFTEAFDILLSALMNSGDSIICENPTHNTAIKIMKLHKLNIIGIKMKRDGIDTDILKKSIKPGIKAAYLIPSYHNPTGIIMSPEKRAQVYEIFKNNNIPIIEDGFNEELRYTGTHIAPIAAFAGSGNSVIYAGSLSKILFPGLRIGWILADKKLVYCLESIKRSRNIHTSFLDQAVLYQYLIDGSFEKYIRKARKVYRERYEAAEFYAKKYIPHKNIYGEGGLHIFVELEDSIDSRRVLDKAYSEGVIFMPGDVFYTDGGGKNTLRLGFSRVTTEEIENGFKIIGKVIENIKK